MNGCSIAVNIDDDYECMMHGTLWYKHLNVCILILNVCSSVLELILKYVLMCVCV